MTTDALRISLRAFCRQAPFRLFVLEFHTGERIKITHPEAVRIFGEVVMHTSAGRQSRLFDASSISQLMELVESGLTGM
jgi:hypothetical protein